MNLNRRLTTAVLGGTLAAAMTFSGASAGTADLDFDLHEVEVDGNGSKAVVATVGDVLHDLELELIDGDLDLIVVELEDSLNNLQALNNVLNNNDIEIDIQDVEVLSDNQRFLNILEEADIDIEDVIGVAILDGGDFLVFVAD